MLKSIFTLNMEKLEKLQFLSKIFQNKKPCRRHNCKWTSTDNSKGWSSTSLDTDNIRLVVIQHDQNAFCSTGSRVLFDSKAEHKPQANTQTDKKKCLFKSGGRCFSPRVQQGSETCPGRPQRPRLASDIKVLEEMMFGSAPMVQKGCSLKVHTIKNPPQVMVTKVFVPTPSNRESNMEHESFDLYSYSMEAPPKRPPNDNSISTSLSQSVPVDVPLPARFQSDDTEDSGISASMASSCSSSFTTSGQSPSSSASVTSVNSLSRRLLRSQQTSFEYSFAKRSSESVGLHTNQRPPCLGIGITFCLPHDDPEAFKSFERFFFSHITLIESHVVKLKVTVEKALQRHYKHMVTEALEVFRSAIFDLYTAPRLSQPIWLSMMCSSSQRVHLHHSFLKDLVSVMDKCDTKNTKFFLSTLITGVLTHHLAWVPTVSPAGATPSYTYLDKHSAKWLDSLAKSHPYNPLWAQLGDLYGAIGFPLRLSRTVIIGSKAELVCKLLHILSYFIRCSDVLERVEERESLDSIDGHIDIPGMTTIDEDCTFENDANTGVNLRIGSQTSSGTLRYVPFLSNSDTIKSDGTIMEHFLDGKSCLNRSSSLMDNVSNLDPTSGNLENDRCCEMESKLKDYSACVDNNDISSSWKYGRSIFFCCVDDVPGSKPGRCNFEIDSYPSNSAQGGDTELHGNELCCVNIVQTEIKPLMLFSIVNNELEHRDGVLCDTSFCDEQYKQGKTDHSALLETAMNIRSLPIDKSNLLDTKSLHVEYDSHNLSDASQSSDLHDMYPYAQNLFLDTTVTSVETAKCTSECNEVIEASVRKAVVRNVGKTAKHIPEQDSAFENSDSWNKEKNCEEGEFTICNNLGPESVSDMDDLESSTISPMTAETEDESAVSSESKSPISALIRSPNELFEIEVPGRNDANSNSLVKSTYDLENMTTLPIAVQIDDESAVSLESKSPISALIESPNGHCGNSATGLIADKGLVKSPSGYIYPTLCLDDLKTETSPSNGSTMPSLYSNNGSTLPNLYPRLLEDELEQVNHVHESELGAVEVYEADIGTLYPLVIDNTVIASTSKHRIKQQSSPDTRSSDSVFEITFPDMDDPTAMTSDEANSSKNSSNSQNVIQNHGIFERSFNSLEEHTRETCDGTMIKIQGTDSNLNYDDKTQIDIETVKISQQLQDNVQEISLVLGNRKIEDDKLVSRCSILDSGKAIGSTNLQELHIKDSIDQESISNVDFVDEVPSLPSIGQSPVYVKVNDWLTTHSPELLPPLINKNNEEEESIKQNSPLQDEKRSLSSRALMDRQDSTFDEYFTDNSIGLPCPASLDTKYSSNATACIRAISTDSNNSVFLPSSMECDKVHALDISSAHLDVMDGYFTDDVAVSLPEGPTKDMVTSTLTMMQERDDSITMDDVLNNMVGLRSRSNSGGSSVRLKSINRQLSSTSSNGGVAVLSSSTPARCRVVTPSELQRRRRASAASSTSHEPDTQDFVADIKDITMPRSPSDPGEEQLKPFDCNFGHSLLAGYSDHYMSDFVLHGTSESAHSVRTKLHTDLSIAVQNSVLDEPITEACCVLADTDNWSVQQYACRCNSPERFNLVDLSASQMVCSILESVYKLCKLKMSPEFCLMHLEDRLQELYFKSKMLSEYMHTHRKMDIKEVHTIIGIDTSDLPLLLAVAGTHTPRS